MDSKTVVQTLREKALQNGEEHADIKLLAWAQILEHSAVDHIRLVRVEKLLEFLLSRQVIEVPRRPSTAEAKAFEAAGLPIPQQVVTKRTLLDEFDITYADFFKQFMTPAPDAAKGEDHA